MSGTGKFTQNYTDYRDLFRGRVTPTHLWVLGRDLRRVLGPERNVSIPRRGSFNKQGNVPEPIPVGHHWSRCKDPGTQKETCRRQSRWERPERMCKCEYLWVRTRVSVGSRGRGQPGEVGGPESVVGRGPGALKKEEGKDPVHTEYLVSTPEQ